MVLPRNRIMACSLVLAPVSETSVQRFWFVSMVAVQSGGPQAGSGQIRAAHKQRLEARIPGRHRLRRQTKPASGRRVRRSRNAHSLHFAGGLL